jgi:aspartate racemase
MKTIGLLGGMSWESSIEYYRIINQQVRKELGGVHSARIVMISLDFAEIEDLQIKGDWKEAGSILIKSAKEIEAAGADFLLICTNTMHLLADQVAESVSIPLLHIADATAAAVLNKSLKNIGLLGTKFTMEKEFYKGRMENLHKLQVIIPDDKQRTMVHDVIYDELVQGKIREQSRAAYLEVITSLIERGAEGIVLGCTEIGLLVEQENVKVPVFDTMEIHAIAAVDAAFDRFPFN